MNKKKELISSEQNIKLSAVYSAYIILKALKNKEKITIFDLYSAIKKKDKVFHYRTANYALIFLYMNGLVDFNSPFIYNAKQK